MVTGEGVGAMRFVVPRFIALLVVCVGVALSTAGCNPFLDYNYYSQGIGTNVYSSAIGAETQAQDVYLNALCEQAGLQPGIYVEGQYSCLPTIRAGDWSSIVQAGFNDIDQRCDGYLAWLDEQRRLKAPILNEINTIQVAAQNIMGLAAASVKSINIVGLAFGFASNTFTNIQSGLLLEVDKSTVETVVIQNQNYYRQNLPGPGSIASRATAIYVLRSYLRICTPFTIANQINTTVTLAHSGAGPGSPLIDPSVVSSTGPVFTPASVVQLPPRAQPIPPDSDIAPFFIETKLTQADTNLALRGLCLDKNQMTGISRADLLRSLIRIYEVTPDPLTPPAADLKISRNERQVIDLQPDCGAAKNYWEKTEYANTLTSGEKANSAARIKSLTDLLSLSPAGGDIPANPKLADLRQKIAAVRKALALNDVPAALNDQVTPELDAALKKLKQH
jgi:hypothetical protein